MEGSGTGARFAQINHGSVWLKTEYGTAGYVPVLLEQEEKNRIRHTLEIPCNPMNKRHILALV
jgi:hypothetical protein